MIGLDQVIGAFVIGQVILSTLQTVSNVVLSKKGSPSHTPAIRSPPPTFVVPPDATMKTVEPDELRRLCDVSIAFREAVELALLERDYTANSIRIESYKPGSSKNVPEHKKPYDLSLRPVTSEADEGLMPKPPLDTNNQGQYDSAENATIPSTTPANATIHSNNENQSILIDYLTTLSLPSRNNHDSMEDNTPPQPYGFVHMRLISLRSYEVSLVFLMKPSGVLCWNQDLTYYFPATPRVQLEQVGFS